MPSRAAGRSAGVARPGLPSAPPYCPLIEDNLAQRRKDAKEDREEIEESGSPGFPCFLALRLCNSVSALFPDGRPCYPCRVEEVWAMLMEWLMLATGFMGALTCVFLARLLHRTLSDVPGITAYFSPK